MNQATPANQKFLWHQRERRECLPGRGNPEKGTWPLAKPVSDSTDFQPDTICPCFYDVLKQDSRLSK